MPALCDIDVLFALVTDRDARHRAALSWFDKIGDGEAVLCRVAQMGLLRLLNNPTVMGDDVLDAPACWEIWQTLLADDRIRFAADEPPQLETAFARMTAGREFTPRLWTAAYLAAYALAGRLTLITFDTGFRKYPDLDCQVLDAARQSGG